MNGGNLPFSTDVQVGHSIYGNTYNDEYTKTLANLTYTGDGTPFSDYALGYIKTDDMPDVYRRTKVDFNPGGDSLKFDYATPDGNYPCGYMSTQGQSLPTYFSECTWSNGTLVRHGQCQQWRFINNCYPELSELGPAAASKNFQLVLRGYYYMSGDDTPISLNTINIGYSDLEYFKGLISSEGVQNIYHYTTSVTYSGTPYNIDLPFNFDTFADIEVHVEDANESGIYFNGFVVGYSFVTSNCMNFFVVEVPEIDSDAGYNRKWIVGGMSWAGTNNFMTIDGNNQNNITATYTSTSHNMNNTNTGALGGLQGEFPVTSIGGVANNLTYLTKSGNVGCFRQMGLNNIHYIQRIFRTQEIKKLLDIALYRESVNNISSLSYTVGRSSAIQVDSDDRFRAEQKEGNIGDEAFKGGLRDWQYIDPDNDAPEDNGFDQNDFDPDADIPEYTPDPPTPPENPDTPEEGPPDDNPEDGPDKDDRGIPIPQVQDSMYPANPSPFVKYGVFTYEDLVILSEQLWNRPNGFFESLAGAQKVDPMDYFVSLRWYPMSMEYGSIFTDLYLGSGGKLVVNYQELASTVYIFNWGSISIKPFYNNFLDYAPYTKLFINLPFSGQIELNPTIVMGKELSLRSAIDVTDGSIVWELYNETDSQPVLTRQGRVGCEVPISSLDASQMASNIINASLGVLNTSARTVSNIGAGAKKGIEVGAAAGPEGSVIGAAVGAIAGGASQAINLMSSISNLGIASKEIPQINGGSTGMAASGVTRYPTILYLRPLSTNPSTYGETVGYLCNKTRQIKQMSGFTICKNSNTNNIPKATEKEKQTIKKILDSGFFV